MFVKCAKWHDRSREKKTLTGSKCHLFVLSYENVKKDRKPLQMKTREEKIPSRCYCSGQLLCFCELTMVVFSSMTPFKRIEIIGVY